MLQGGLLVVAEAGGSESDGDRVDVRGGAGVGRGEGATFGHAEAHRRAGRAGVGQQGHGRRCRRPCRVPEPCQQRREGGLAKLGRDEAVL